MQAHRTDGGGGDGVGDAGRFDIEGAEGKVGGLGGRWDEGEEGVGGRVEFPITGAWLAVVGVGDVAEDLTAVSLSSNFWRTGLLLLMRRPWRVCCRSGLSRSVEDIVTLLVCTIEAMVFS